MDLLIEILKAACADREYRYGDPLFVDVGLEELLSDAHVRARVGAIDMQRAMPDMPPPIGRYPANNPSSAPTVKGEKRHRRRARHLLLLRRRPLGQCDVGDAEPTARGARR